MSFALALLMERRFLVLFLGYCLGAVIPLVLYEPRLFSQISLWVAIVSAGIYGALSEPGGMFDEPSYGRVFLHGASVFLVGILLHSLIFPVIERGVLPFFGPLVMTFGVTIVSVGWFLLPIGGGVAIAIHVFNRKLDEKQR